MTMAMLAHSVGLSVVLLLVIHVVIGGDVAVSRNGFSIATRAGHPFVYIQTHSLSTLAGFLAKKLLILV